MGNKASVYDPERFAAAGGPGLHDELSDVTAQIRLLEAKALDIVAEMESADIARLAGYRTLPLFLRATQRLSARQAARMVAHAEQTAQRLTPTGHRQPAALPAVREALAEGVLDGEHVQVIIDALKDLPPCADAAARELVETTLVAEARSNEPGYVREVGKALLDRIDQDGPEPRAEDLAEPVNLLRYSRSRNGRMKLTADLDPETGELLDALLSPLSKPQPISPSIPDPRSAAQRLGDAFCDVIRLAAAAEAGPSEGGHRPTIIVTFPYEKLAANTGHAAMELAGSLPAAAVRRAACDCGIIPAILDSNGVPLDLGRANRTVTPDLRRALILRDKGCAMPGCTHRPRWCEAHHILSWLDLGETELDNLVLLCRRHHRMVEHSDWEVRMVDRKPVFTPPRFLDPSRTPLVNTLRQ
jgi:hypothetical protein